MSQESSVLTIKQFRAKTPANLYELKSVVNVRGVYGIKLKTSPDDRIQQNHSLRKKVPTEVTYKEVPGWIYTDFEEVK